MKRFLLFATILISFSISNTMAQRIVFFGDSLTAGYGLDPENAFPALIEKRLKEIYPDVIVINAGVSGDTSAGGLRRLNWILRSEVNLLFVALGANDALRGQPVETTQDNLRKIIQQAREAYPSIQIILGGMLAPPNMGETYAQAFAQIYPKLAQELNVDLVPFLLEGVAGDDSLNLADGIHPNIQGHQIIAELVFPFVLEAIFADK